MMHFNHVTVATLLNAIVAVTANPDPAHWDKCWTTYYDTGIDFEPNRDVVKNHVHNACLGWPGNHGYYQDVYYKSWNQSPFSNKLCVNTDDDSHVNMEIANLNPNVGFTLNNNDCYKELAGLVDIAYQGGEYQCNGWWFRIDPNRGLC